MNETLSIPKPKTIKECLGHTEICVGRKQVAQSPLLVPLPLPDPSLLSIQGPLIPLVQLCLSICPQALVRLWTPNLLRGGSLCHEHKTPVIALHCPGHDSVFLFLHPVVHWRDQLSFHSLTAGFNPVVTCVFSPCPRSWGSLHDTT